MSQEPSSSTGAVSQSQSEANLAEIEAGMELAGAEVSEYIIPAQAQSVNMSSVAVPPRQDSVQSRIAGLR